MDVLGASTDDHLRLLLKLIVESHFRTPVAPLAVEISPTGDGHCLVSSVERLNLNLTSRLSHRASTELESLAARCETPRGHHSRRRMVELLYLLRNPCSSHEAILFIISSVGVLRLKRLLITFILGLAGMGPALIRCIRVGLHLVGLMERVIV